MAIKFTGPAKKIEDIDLPRVGARIGVGEDEIHAVMDVEAAGSGFDKRGRPKMLFEPHVFYRNLSVEKRSQAVQEGLAYKNWKRGAYPADSYPRLTKAMLIDETAALRSASWGLGQILGENHRAAGYPTVQAMVTDFTLDEDNHLEAMIRFIVTNKLDQHIRSHNWAAFARGYNGPGYATHGYHTKLAAAYRKWGRIKDTPYSAGQDEGKTSEGPRARDQEDEQETQELKGDVNDRDEMAIAESDTTVDEDNPVTPLDANVLRAYQTTLKSMGYHEVGIPDGKMGSRTVSAISAFQFDRSLGKTGEFDEPTLAEMQVATDEKFTRPISPERAEGVPENSRIIDGAQKSQGAGLGAIILGFFTFVGNWMREYVPFAREIFDMLGPVVRPIQSIVVDNFGLILLGVGGVVLWQASRIYKARVEDHQKGEIS